MSWESNRRSGFFGVIDIPVYCLIRSAIEKLYFCGGGGVYKGGWLGSSIFLELALFCFGLGNHQVNVWIQVSHFCIIFLALDGFSGADRMIFWAPNALAPRLSWETHGYNVNYEQQGSWALSLGWCVEHQWQVEHPSSRFTGMSVGER